MAIARRRATTVTAQRRAMTAIADRRVHHAPTIALTGRINRIEWSAGPSDHRASQAASSDALRLRPHAPASSNT